VQGATYYYPFSAPSQLNEVEEAKPCRTALLSMVLKDVSVDEATETACSTVNYLLLPLCDTYVHVVVGLHASCWW
jgi:hypothetical protein